MSASAMSARVLLEACPSAAFVLAADTTILATNSEAERVFCKARPSVGPDGIVGLKIATAVPCGLGPRIARAIGAEAGQGASRFRVDIGRDAGRVHAVEVLIWPAPLAGAVGPHWVVLVLDRAGEGAAETGIICTGAAALRVAEEARRKAQESADILRFSTETSDLAPWSYDPETRRLQIGPHFATMLGHPVAVSQDLVQLATLTHPEDLACLRTSFRGLESGLHDSIRLDFRIARGDGSWAWICARGQRVTRRAPGLPTLICGSLTDISTRKADEARLAAALASALHARTRAQQREEMLRTSGLCAGIGHFCASPLAGEGWTPDETYRLFGYEPGDFPPDDAGWRSLIHPEDLPAAITAMENLKSGRSDLYDHTHRRRHKDGSYHWYRAVARRVDRSELGMPALIAGAVNCIDHAKETEKRLADAADAARLARERLDTLADNAPGALFECRVDAGGGMALPYFSAKLPDLAAVSRAAILADACSVFAHVPRRTVARLVHRAAAALKTGAGMEMRVPVRGPEGPVRWISVAALPFRRSDASVRWFGQILDVTETVETERRAALAAEAAHRAHARLASIATVAPAGLYEVERRPDGAARIPYASPHFRSLLGLGQTDTVLLGEAETQVQKVDLADLPAFLTCREEAALPTNWWHQRFCIQHPERGQVWLSNSATAQPQSDGGVVWTGALHDVTGDVRREAELRAAYRLAEDRREQNEWQALHDGLTGLPNRRYYDQVLAERIGQAAASTAAGCTLIRIDLDHFKHVNDTLGHDAGDLVLCRVANVLRESLQEGDFAARLGGDEFSVVLARGLTREDAGALIARIQSRLAEPLIYAGRQCRFGASFGIAEAEDLAATGAEIQFFADAALYRAKETGRNRMEFFTPELHQNLRRDRELAAELQEGLERDEFEPHFQAQVSAKDHRLTGVETLLRWRHPRRGLLAPASFMHIAEQLRLVPEIDRVMMEKSRTALKYWRGRGLIVPKISFNVSSGRMNDPDVVRAAQTIARGETRVAFELLESILVEDESDLFRFHLEAIRDAGIDIEIDDFGSGHASIIGLMQIAPSVLKIDRRIVEPLGRDPQARNLVRAIIEIAETLGTATVAEGVETELQAEILRDLGCDVLQGYLFSLPLSAADFAMKWHGVACRV